MAENLRCYFQQDGAPPHTAGIITNYLNNNFQNHWIGLRGPIPWPARSPDITLCDFYLWGRITNMTFRRPPEDRQDLENHLLDSFESLRNLELLNAARSTKKRCRLCLRQNGRHFEHLL